MAHVPTYICTLFVVTLRAVVTLGFGTIVASTPLDGFVMAIGTTQDLLDWVPLLQERPALTLLTFRGVLLGPMSRQRRPGHGD